MTEQDIGKGVDGVCFVYASSKLNSSHRTFPAESLQPFGCVFLHAGERLHQRLGKSGRAAAIKETCTGRWPGCEDERRPCLTRVFAHCFHSLLIGYAASSSRSETPSCAASFFHYSCCSSLGALTRDYASPSLDLCETSWCKCGIMFKARLNEQSSNSFMHQRSVFTSVLLV